jgi:lysophospholipid acyltransferase (LPLAT)-like uncharacterized protein
MPRKSKKIIYRLVEWLGPWLILLIGYTLRIRRVNYEPVKQLVNEKKPHLFSLWHGRMFVPMFVHRQQGIIPMISQHADGEMITRVVKKLGYGSVRGSSTRRGKEAFHELVDHLKSEGVGAMLPDGPTGPRHHFKPGTLFIASKADCPLVPVTFAAKSCWRVGSWDRFVVPKPFSKCVIFYGDPVEIPPQIPEDEMEQWRFKLEEIMVGLVKSAEAVFGRKGIDD